MKPVVISTDTGARSARRTSNKSRRMWAAGAIVSAAAILTLIDTPLTRPWSSESIATPSSQAEPPRLQESTPSAEATDVPGRAPLVVRFSKPMAASSLNPRSITLVGPSGQEPTRIVPAGTLAVIQPMQELLPASRYTLFISGAADDDQRVLPLTAIGFDTAAKSGARPGGGAELVAAPVPRPIAQLGPLEQVALAQADATRGAQDWVPGPANFSGHWRADRGASPLQSLPSLQAPAGTTALTGQVLGMDGRAMPGVTLRVEDHEARTDLTGRFVLAGLTAGFAKMEIDGATANSSDASYGYYAARIELKAGQTTVVPYTIWMPRLDPTGTVHIDAPTTSETIVRSPRIPGLELHIPAGTVIRDRQGQIVTELNLTAIPVDRPPFPVPDLGVPVYFTVQPGGAVLQSVNGKPGPGARLFYPNFNHEVPGARGTFWNYDPDDREWFVYGMGTISADATQAVPNDGVVIHELTGAMFNGGNTPPDSGRPLCQDLEDEDSCGEGGDPVTAATGQFDHVEQDAFLSDVISIDVSRTYNNFDLNQRTFGDGMMTGYDVFLYSQNQWQEVDLILPSGSKVHYQRTSPGTGYADAIFASSAPGTWHSSVIARNQDRAGWDLIFSDGSRWFFPQFQPLTEITDRNGNVLRVIRQDNNGTAGKIARIISPNGRSLDFTYNTAGFASQVTDNIGRSYYYNYDATGHLIEVIDPAGGHRTYTWDSYTIGTNNYTVYQLAEIRDARGNLTVRTEYDANGRVGHQVLGDGSTYDYSYTLVSFCPPGGVIVDPSCVARPVAMNITDRRGTVRIISLDSQGRVVKNTYGAGLPEQQVVSYEYTNELISARIDPMNRRTEYTYDTKGNLTSVTRMAGTAEAATWTTTWDPATGQPLTIMDPNGHGSTVTYDGRGNIVTIQNEPGQTWSYTYDAQGRKLTITDPLGKVTALSYNGGDPASVTSAAGRSAHFLFDAAGRLISTIDQLGNRTAGRWDDRDGALDITDALGGVTSFLHDENGNLLSHTDPKGHTTTYSFNVDNQILQKHDPLGKQVTLSYDTAGQLAQRVDGRGQLQAMTYDALGRLKSIAIGATPAHPLAFTSVVENTRDVAGRITQIAEMLCSDPLGHPNCSSVATTKTIKRAYDNFDHLTQEVTFQGEVNYVYDSIGRRRSMTIKNGPPGAQIVQPTVTYGYDAANRLTQITQAAGAINGGYAAIIAFTYDGVGRRTQTMLANGATITYSYDDSGKLVAIDYKKADGSVIGDLQYQYDKSGRRSSVGGSLAQINLPLADVSDASYDADDRLLTWAGKIYSYDDDGNLTNDSTYDYVWNDGNRLTAIRNGANTVASFQYDSLCRRSGKTINTTTTGFFYDHDNIAQELSDSSVTAAVTAHILSGATDEVFLRLEGNTGASQQSVLSDGSNNTIGLLDASQTASVSYAYEPYGATTTTATNSNTQEYTGRENDNPGNNQGLYYYRARYYMPQLGRFISQDPLRWASGQTNPYAYSGNDPVNFADPSGLDGTYNASGHSRGGGGGFPGWFDDESEDFDGLADKSLKLEEARNEAKNAGRLLNKGLRASSSEGLSAKLGRDLGVKDFQATARAAGVGDATIASGAKTAQNATTELAQIKTLQQAVEADEAAILATERSVMGVANTAEDAAAAESEVGLVGRLVQLVEEFE